MQVLLGIFSRWITLNPVIVGKLILVLGPWSSAADGLQRLKDRWRVGAGSCFWVQRAFDAEMPRILTP